MSRDRYKIWTANAPYFLTDTIVGWLPAFNRRENTEIVLNAWKFQHETGRINLYAYVILENHIHFIASSPDLPKRIKEFKSYTARRIVDFLISRGDHELLDQFQRLKLTHHASAIYQVWQEGSHPIEITSDEMMGQKVKYIHINPVRRGYVDKPEDWRYSSARNYLDIEGLIPVETDWRK